MLQYQSHRSGQSVMSLKVILLTSLISSGLFLLYDIKQDRAGSPEIDELNTVDTDFLIDDQKPTLLLGHLPNNQVASSQSPDSSNLPLIQPELADTLENFNKDEADNSVEVTENAKNPLEIVQLDVPFTPQAPFGNWADPRQDYGCEEGSLLMVWHYLSGQPLTRQLALAEITAISDWELEQFGEFRDSSAHDTAEFFKQYFNYESVRVVYDIKLRDILDELDLGRPVIVPVDGQILDNPYYTPPGPLHHMLVVIGYDPVTEEVITNDPGTRRGQGIRYTYANFDAALRDYDSGHAEQVIQNRRAIIVIE